MVSAGLSCLQPGQQLRGRSSSQGELLLPRQEELLFPPGLSVHGGSFARLQPPLSTHEAARGGSGPWTETGLRLSPR